MIPLHRFVTPSLLGVWSLSAYLKQPYQIVKSKLTEEFLIPLCQSITPPLLGSLITKCLYNIFLNSRTRLLWVNLQRSSVLIPLYLSITSSLLQDFDRGHRLPYSKNACDTPLKYLNLNDHVGMFWKWALSKRIHRLRITIVGTVIHIIHFSTIWAASRCWVVT